VVLGGLVPQRLKSILVLASCFLKLLSSLYKGVALGACEIRGSGQEENNVFWLKLP